MVSRRINALDSIVIDVKEKYNLSLDTEFEIIKSIPRGPLRMSVGCFDQDKKRLLD